MFPPQCLFCDHANPAGAKFCNNCGSPLHLKLCKECDAVNDRSAKNCYECGAEFELSATAADAEPVSPLAETLAVSDALNDMRLKSGHVTLPESVAESLEELRRRLANESSDGRQEAIELGAAKVHTSSLLFAAAHDQDQLLPPPELAPKEQRRPLSRLGLATSLAILFFAAVGLSVNYLYQGPTQFQGWLGAKQLDSGSHEDAGAEGEPVQPVRGNTTEPTLSSPSAGADTAGVAASASAAPALPDDRPIELPAAPAAAAGAEAAGANGVEHGKSITDAAQAPEASQPQTSAQATAAQGLPAETEAVAAAPESATAAAIGPRPKTMSVASKRGGATHTAANRSSASSTAATVAPAPSITTNVPARVPQDSVPQGACEEVVAALGLCSWNAR